MKLLGARPHGYLDYAIVFALAFAPAVFKLSPGAPRLASYGAAVVLFVLSVLTASPLVPERRFPFRVHALVELALALALAASPWLLRFATDVSDRNFFLAAGALLFVVWAVSDYAGEPAAG